MSYPNHSSKFDIITAHINDLDLTERKDLVKYLIRHLLFDFHFMTYEVQTIVTDAIKQANTLKKSTDE